MLGAVGRPLFVGPLALEVALDGGLPAGALGRLAAGFDPGPVAPARRTVRLRVAPGGAPWDRHDATIRLRAAADGTLTDASECWDATLRGFAPAGRPEATARLRPFVVERDLVAHAVALFAKAAVATAAVLENALLLHGCALRPPGGDAVLFAGASGQGKTTMARRLPGWTLLADDAVLVEVPPDGPATVRGTPFAGKEGHPRRGEAAPLGRIALLRPHAPAPAVRPVGPGEAFEALLARTFWFAAEGPLLPRVLALVERLAARVPVLRLETGLAHDPAPLLAASAPRLAGGAALAARGA